MRLQSFASLEVNLPQLGPVRLPAASGGPLVGFLPVYTDRDEAIKHAKDPALVHEIRIVDSGPIPLVVSGVNPKLT